MEGNHVVGKAELSVFGVAKPWLFTTRLFVVFAQRADMR
jgi:hypothetical protein